MFSNGTLSKDVTPRRVYALLKLIAYTNKKCTKEQIFKYIQPEYLSDSQAEVKRVFKFCLDEGLIAEDFDNKVSINFKEEFIKSEECFRKYINSILFSETKNNSFYSISKSILTKEIELYDFSGFENIGLMLNTDNSQKDLILGWRFWAAFLGYGFILNSQFVLNPYIRIKDLIEIRFESKKNITMPFKEFINELISVSPEFEASIKENNILLPMALALTTLNDLGIISLSNVRDSEDIWQFNLGSAIQMITHINLLGGE